MIGQFFTGMMQGYSQGQLQKQQNELQNALLKIQMQNAKNQAEQLKLKTAQQEFQQQLLQMLMQTRQPGQMLSKTPSTGVSAPIGFAAGPTAQAKPGLMGMMTGPSPQSGLSQIYNNPDLILMGEMAGIPLSKIAQTQMQAQRGITIEKPDSQGNMHRFLIDPRTGAVKAYLGLSQQAPLQPMTVPTPEGGARTRFVNPRQTMQQGFVSKLPEIESYKYEMPDGSITEKYRYKASKQDVPGLEPTALRGKKAKGQEAAGKIATIRNALRTVDYIRDKIIKPNGRIDRKMVFNMQCHMPFSEGRKLYAMFSEGLDAKTRIMTGAAMREEELAFYERMFLPQIWDSDDTITNKLDRFEQFLKEAYSEMAPGEALPMPTQSRPTLQLPQKSIQPRQPGESIEQYLQRTQ